MMKKIYYPKNPFFVAYLMILFACCGFTLLSKWNSSGSFIALLLALMFWALVIIFSKPLLEYTRVEIDDDKLRVYKNFHKTKEVYIPDSLYQVDGDITPVFRFHYGNNFFQISPLLYRDGDELNEVLMKCIKKHKIIVDMV